MNSLAHLFSSNGSKQCYISCPPWLSQKGTVCALCKPSDHVYTLSRPRCPCLHLGTVLHKRCAMGSIIACPRVLYCASNVLWAGSLLWLHVSSQQTRLMFVGGLCRQHDNPWPMHWRLVSQVDSVNFHARMAEWFVLRRKSDWVIKVVLSVLVCIQPVSCL